LDEAKSRDDSNPTRRTGNRRPVRLGLNAASLPTPKPEEVGLSTERLQRIHEAVMRRVEAKELSGAVTIVA
jgi:hypothetical protein